MTTTTQRGLHRAAPLILAAIGIAAVLTLTLHGGTIDALAGAGVTGKMPKEAGAIAKILDALNENMIWLIVTCAATAITLGGVLMALGHSRAQDHLIRIGGGIGVALFLAPAIVA